MIISIVIPCYRSEKNIAAVIDMVMEQFPAGGKYEAQPILVCDGSPDGTFEEIRHICNKHNNVTGICLTRNYGQQNARLAALPYVKGDSVIFMDDDGQHPASGIISLIDRLEQGYDVVYAFFTNKRYSILQYIGDMLHKKVVGWLVGKPKDINFSSYFIVKRFIVEGLKNYASSDPYFAGYILKITKNISMVSLPYKDRITGKSGYTIKKLIQLWMNGLIGFSILPLKIVTVLGVLIAIIGFIFGFYLFVDKLINPNIAVGYTSIMATILLVGGLNILILGLIGEYIGRMYLVVNRIPQYTVREIIQSKDKSVK